MIRQRLADGSIPWPDSRWPASLGTGMARCWLPQSAGVGARLLALRLRFAPIEELSPLKSQAVNPMLIGIDLSLGKLGKEALRTLADVFSHGTIADFGFVAERRARRVERGAAHRAIRRPRRSNGRRQML